MPGQETLAALAQRVAALEDIEAIKVLKHRYFRLLDQQSWDALRGCFTDDVETNYEGGHYRFTGIDDAMRFLSESLVGLRAGGRISMHMGHHPEIELTSDTTATGVWTLHSVAVHGAGERLAQLAAYYRDEYRKDDGVWKIARTGYDPHFHAEARIPGIRARSGADLDSRAMNTAARASQAGG